MPAQDFLPSYNGTGNQLRHRNTSVVVNPNTNATTTTITSYSDSYTFMGVHATILYNSRIYLFGGRNGVTLEVYDTFIYYDLAIQKWQHPRITSGTPPSARCGSSFILSSSTTSGLIYGGTDASFTTVHSDFFRFDLSTGAWSALSVTGSPGARFGHRVVMWGELMVLFGGRSTSSTAHNTTWLFNPTNSTQGGVASNTWAQLSTTNNPPVRSWAGGDINPNTGILYILGGQGSDGKVVADFWSLNLATGVWSSITAGGRPSGRIGVSVRYLNGFLYCRGGAKDLSSDPETDLRKYNTANNTWINITTFSLPTARTFFQWLVSGTKMYSTGGYTGPNGIDVAGEEGVWESDFTTELAGTGNISSVQLAGKTTTVNSTSVTIDQLTLTTSISSGKSILTITYPINYTLNNYHFFSNVTITTT